MVCRQPETTTAAKIGGVVMRSLGARGYPPRTRRTRRMLRFGQW